MIKNTFIIGLLLCFSGSLFSVSELSADSLLEAFESNGLETFLQQLRGCELERADGDTLFHIACATSNMHICEQVLEWYAANNVEIPLDQKNALGKMPLDLFDRVQSLSKMSVASFANAKKFERGAVASRSSGRFSGSRKNSTSSVEAHNPQDFGGASLKEQEYVTPSVACLSESDTIQPSLSASRQEASVLVIDQASQGRYSTNSASAASSSLGDPLLPKGSDKQKETPSSQCCCCIS